MGSSNNKTSGSKTSDLANKTLLLIPPDKEENSELKLRLRRQYIKYFNNYGKKMSPEQWSFELPVTEE